MSWRQYRGHKLAVIATKCRDLPTTAGVAQAKHYAAKLETRFAYTTNGLGIYQIDMQTGAESPISQYPPDTLWDTTYREANPWRDRFAAIPLEDPTRFLRVCPNSCPNCYPV
ncbi:hypothetical protein [Trichothermofontia sp.]